MKNVYRLFVFALVILLTACSSQGKSPNTPQDPEVDLVSIFTEARKPLFNSLNSVLDKDKPFISTSFVNIDHLSVTSTFGRIAGEMISAGLTQLGFQVKEIKMRDSLFVQQQGGEFMLSRKLRHISKSLNAQAVLIGTYAVGGKYIYVSSRVVRTTDNMILGTHNFSIPLNKDIRQLLANQYQ